jgi:flagellar biosynthetic protein FlhB
MSDGADDDDKQHEPSQRRLDEARKKGQVPRSQEISSAAVQAALVVVLMVQGTWILAGFGALGSDLIGQPHRFLGTDGLQAALAPAYLQTNLLLGTLLLPLSAAALISLFAQRALIFAPDKLMPKLSRISLSSNARQKFGLEGMVEFAKSMIKMLVISGILTWQISRHAEDLFMANGLAVEQSFSLAANLLMAFLITVTLWTLALGAVDFLWQRFRHIRQNRMSRQEVIEESKDSEGDPHIRSHRRQRAQEVALSNMLADVGKADVIIVNPTHYAVALRWKRSDMSAPVCVAKGVDEIAARIRETARLAGIPLHSDPPTARALHATVKVGQPIRQEHYRAVAAAIRFSEKIQKRRKGKPL